METILTDVWSHIQEAINWVIVLLVISSGYLGRNQLFRTLTKITSQTARVVIISLIVTVGYTFFAKISASVFIASYFFAFGFHTVIIKFVERKINQ